MNFDYAESIGALDADQRVYFYQLLAHFMTVSMRGILFHEGVADEERIERAKWLNEIQHRITYKIFLLKKNSSDYPEEEIWDMIRQNSNKHPKTADDVNLAIETSFKYVLENEGDSARAGN
ncbi:MAG: hypothetical protein R2747_10335 [Pyrinomonadaceae bacterium]